MSIGKRINSDIDICVAWTRGLFIIPTMVLSKVFRISSDKSMDIISITLMCLSMFYGV